MTACYEGECDPQFGAVRDAFVENLEGLDLGAGVSVWIEGRQVVNLWGGYRDEARERPWTEDTLVLVASVTKAFATICLLQLIEQGRVQLDAPVSTYWPEFGQAGKEAITVLDVLTHRSGVPGIEKPFEFDAFFNWNEIIGLIEKQRPLWPPGTQHGYHPILFGNLVGEVVRRVSGMSLGAYLQKNVCKPLGLDFFIGVPDSELSRIADVSFAEPALMRPEEEFEKMFARAAIPGTITQIAFGNPPPVAGIANTARLRRSEMPASNGHGTAEALAKFYAALSCGGVLNGVRVLSDEMLKEASREWVFENDVVLDLPSRYGLGFMLHYELFPIGPNHHAFGHPGAGGNLGFADPDRKLGFGYVMNRGKPSVHGSPTAYKLVDALYASL